MKNTFHLFLIGIFSFLGMVTRVRAQSYNVVILSNSDSYALGVNDSGQVIGQGAFGFAGSGTYHAALFTASGGSDFTDLDPSGIRSSTAVGINNSGVIVGHAGTAFHATIFSGSGNTDLGTLGGVGSSDAFAVNNSGMVVGVATTSGGLYQAAVFSGTGNTALGTLGGSASAAYGVNDAGAIVGTASLAGDGASHATVFSGTGNADLGTLGGTNSYAYGINNTGLIIGAAAIGSGALHATIFSGTGNTDLGTLGGTTSSAVALNSSGEIVGWSLTSSGSMHGFLYTSGTMTDINSLVSGSSGVTGIYINHGNTINNWGQIAAVGGVGNQGRALLLNPVNPLTSVSAGVQDVKLVAGMNYTQIAAYANVTGKQTQVSFLDGTAAKNRDVQVSFLTATAGLASDIAQLTITTPDGTTQQDKFVLSLSYTGSGTNTSLAYFDTNTNSWANAVLGNSDGGASANFINGAYNPSTDFVLGDYGINTVNDTVWAVVDHNSEFAAVPDSLLDYSISDNMSGGGSVIKSGANTVTLTGSNTYTGPTIVQGGTLKAGSANAFSPNSAFSVDTGATLDVNGFFTTIGSLSNGANGGGTVTNSGTAHVTLLVGSDNTSTGYSGAITDGAGTLILQKTGNGTLTLTGAFTNKGLDVSGGELILNGSTTGDVQIDHAVFGGNNTIGGNLNNNGGIVSPGNSPGTITVNGNYVQASTGTLLIQIAGLNPGQHDLLAVGGTAALGGAVQIVRLNNFQPKAGDRVTFLTATGGIIGGFSTTIGTGTLLDAKVIEESNNTLLAVFTQGEFVSLGMPGSPNFTGLTRNQNAVAANLDTVVNNPRAGGLISFLDNEPITKLPYDLDLLAPEQLTALYQISFSAADVQQGNLENRMQDIRNGSTGFVSLLSVMDSKGTVELGGDGKAAIAGKENDAFQPSPGNRWGMFVSGNGEFVNVDGDSNARGYDFTTGGITLGVDCRVNENLAVGVAMDYAHTSTSLANGGSIDADSGRLGIYATWFRNGFYFNGYAGGGYTGFDTGRSALLGNARGSTESGEFDSFLGAGYDFHRGAWSFGPVVSAQYTYAHINDYTEAGSLAPLNIASQGQDSMSTDLGWKVSYAGHVGKTAVTPHLKLGWRHEYAYGALPVDSQLASSGGGVFTVYGPSVGRDSAVIEIGINVQWNERISAYLNYDAIVNADYQSNNITGGVNISF